jgi:hypothetical protein
VTGDTVVAVIANATNDEIAMTIDLPFNTQGGQLYSTTQSDDMSTTTLTTDGETNSPTATVSAQSVSTLLFVRSGQTDGIAGIEADKSSMTQIYDLSGRVVQASAMKPGLYIKNRKKIVVR